MGVVQRGSPKSVTDLLGEFPFLPSAFKSSNYKWMVFLIIPTAHFEVSYTYGRLLCKSQVRRITSFSAQTLYRRAFLF